jgi:hypothetical protein
MDNIKEIYTTSRVKYTIKDPDYLSTSHKLVYDKDSNQLRDDGIDDLWIIRGISDMPSEGQNIRSLKPKRQQSDATPIAYTSTYRIQRGIAV